MSAVELARLLHGLVMPGQDHPGGEDDPASEWPCREWAEKVIGSVWLADIKAAAWDEGASAHAENEARQFWMDGDPISNPHRST